MKPLATAPSTSHRRFASRGQGLWLAFVIVSALAATSARAANYYWDVNNTTDNGVQDGAGTWQNSTLNTTRFLIETTPGVVPTTGSNVKWFNTATGLQNTVTFGASGTGGTITIGSSSGANGPAALGMTIGPTVTTPYTFSGASTSGTSTFTIGANGITMSSGAMSTLFDATRLSIVLSSSGGATTSLVNNSSSATLTINAPISGANAISSSGVGTTVLGGSNSFSGGLTVSQGVLRATDSNALGTGAVAVSSGGTLDVRAAITKNVSNSGTISIGAGGNLSASSLGGALTLGGVSGTVARLTSTLGSGTLALGSLSATGNTNVSLAAGSQISATGALGFSGANNLITLTGVTAAVGNYTLLQGSSLTTSGLSLTGGAVGNNTIGLGNSTTIGRTTYEFASSATALLLNVTGTTYNLVWDNTVASGTWNDTSAVWLQNGSGSPITFVNNDSTTFGTAATISVPAAVAPGSMTISNGSGVVDISGAGSISATSLSKSGAGAATIAVGGTVANGVTVSAGSLTTNGPLSVTAGGIAVNGGSLTSGSTTTVTAGGLTLAANTAFTGNGSTTITSGGLSVGSGATFTGNGATTISANGLTVTGGTATFGVAGTITGGITANGGRVTLNAAHTVSGAISGSNGGVIALNAGTLGSGGVTLDNGTLSAGSSVSSLSNSVTVGAGGATIDNAAAFALAGTITGSNNVLTKTGAGALTISGAVGASKAGVQVNVNAGSLVFSGATVKELGGSSVFNGNVTINSSTLTLSQNAGISGSGILALTGVSTINVRNGSSGGTKTISNAVSLDGVASLAGTSGGNLSLTGLISGSGAVTTSGNSKIALASATAGGFSGTLTVNNSGASGYTDVNTPALDAATSIVINRNASNDFDLQISNSVQDELPAVISGAGILQIAAGTTRAILAGNNTFSGGANLKGDVGIKTSTGLGAGTIASLGSGGRVYWDGAAAAVTIANNLSTGTASSYVLAFAPGSGKTIMLTGSVTGAGQLKVSGGGDLDLVSLAANTSTGGIEIGTGRVITNFANLGSGTINFGTQLGSYLVATTSGTLAAPVTIGSASANGYTANFDTNGNSVTITSAINNKAGNVNGGMLTKLGAGTLTLAAANGYTGVTTVAAGTLLAGNAGAFGSGGVAVAGGTLDLGSLAVGNPLTLTSGGLANAANFVGTQTVNGTFSYSAGTIGGTVNAVAGGVLKGSGVTFGGAVTIGDGATHAPGNSPGSQTFTNGLTYSGSSTLQWELIGNTTTAPGTNYDTISVTGGELSIGPSAIMQMIFNGAGSTVDWNDTFWNTGHTWTVIGVGAGLASTGSFSLLGDSATWLDANSLSLASAMTPNDRAVSNFTLDNSTGSILLTYTVVSAVPEPGTLALAGLGIAGLAMRWARRRRRD